MQQMIDEAGNIWNVDAQGNATYVGGAGQQRGGGMQIKPADPTRQYDLQKAQADAAKASADAAVAGQMNQAQLAKAQADLAKAQTETAGAKLTPAARADAINGYQYANQLDQIVRQLESQYKTGPGSTSGLGGIQDYLPLQANRQFDSTADAARGIVGQALGFTGGQLNSIQEAEASVGPYLPKSGDRDAVILDKIARLRSLANTARQRSVAILGGVPDANGQITPVQPGQLPTTNAADPMQGATVLPRAAGAHDQGGMQATDVTSKGGLQEIPQLRGIENQVIDMIGKGASTGQVVDFLDQHLGQYGARVDTNLMGYIGDIVRKHKANPSQPVRSLGTGWEMLYHKKLPDQKEANTFLGINPDSTAGNFLATTANAATAGLPAYLAGKKDVMDAAAAERPGSSLAGEIVGGAASMTGINRAAGALGKAGTLLTRGGGIGGDMLYGATRGGMEDGPQGVLTGALAAAAGNKIGSGIVSGTGSAVRGVSSPAVRYLADKGIPMTAGQMLGNRGMVGRTMNKLESLPFIGDALQQRRMEGIKAFNEEAFRQAVDPINGPFPGIGPEGIQSAQQAVGQAYDNAYGGINLTPDAQFAQEAGAAVQQGRSVPVIGEQFDYIMRNNIAPLGQGGAIDGPRLQAALQTLKGARSSFAQEGAMGNEAAGAVSGVEDAINNMVARQAPGALPAIGAANTANRNVSTLGNAVMANGDGMFTPAQLRRAGINNTKKFGGAGKAARGDIPFRDLVSYGQDVLPPTIPNSGTADRGLASALLPAALGGGAVGAQQLGEPKIAVPLGILAALTSKNGAKVAQKALTGRSDAARAIGVAIRKQRRKGGLFGSALATGAVMPQLSQ